ncbi:hypothetical protein QJS10_CPA02g00936 [Acorus calamus]|uniref:Uncharacterized protein n=1 Tax=Acorus calamus TaxID=4465 RepID=A0AAV9FCL1_ACOCL|nr:hypothetical protein QJS10_CPA02g00936 [Acorus calamus]
MDQHVFIRLADLFRKEGWLEDTRNMFIEEHMKTEDSEIQCACGRRPMVLLMARTSKNCGRWFLRCPARVKKVEKATSVAHPTRVRHIRVDTCSDRSTDLCLPNETHFDWASVDTYSDSSTDLCRPGEEHFDWTLSNWETIGRMTPIEAPQWSQIFEAQGVCPTFALAKANHCGHVKSSLKLMNTRCTVTQIVDFMKDMELNERHLHIQTISHRETFISIHSNFTS